MLDSIWTMVNDARCPLVNSCSFLVLVHAQRTIRDLRMSPMGVR